MHLRGPMNISQLAIYQLPSDFHTLSKRMPVPFYNGRQAFDESAHDLTPDNSLEGNQGSTLGKRTFDTMARCGLRTITRTVTVTECTSTFGARTGTPIHNTTYVGPALPCMPTPALSSPGSDCPCKSATTPTRNPMQGQLPSRRFPNQSHVPSSPFPTEYRKIANNSSKLDRRDATNWSRVAYYTSAAPAQATGLSFLANRGDPQKSGTFD